MTPEELRVIVARQGGTKKFAAKLRVSTRIVEYRLAASGVTGRSSETASANLPNPSTKVNERYREAA